MIHNLCARAQPISLVHRSLDELSPYTRDHVSPFTTLDPLWLVSSHNNVLHFFPNSSSGHDHPYPQAFTHDCSTVWNAPLASYSWGPVFILEIRQVSVLCTSRLPSVNTHTI